MQRFFGFPSEVNDAAARLVAAGVLTLALVGAVGGVLLVAVILTYGFAARVLAGPRYSPLARAALWLVPRLSLPVRFVPGPPKRFAQSLGLVFSASALTCWLAGAPLDARVILGVLALPAGLESIFGYCIGCEIFGRLMRRGLIPESVCVQCADLASARTRRASPSS